ncbi:Mammalian ependymin-related protein 1 [Acropora cervicornis]|uniref:Mammalian ependymin-related protein 1 n=1 Tax=Acropora cervicornis TaxID=6130 RepID=A0AAD9QUE2_ACRCE|nr:Mammalian ependymin-related protein 1 [Acropora cervicornis]
MFAVVVSLLLVGVVNAQRPKPCETPEVWTGRQMMFVRSMNVSVFAKLSYDAIEERLSIDEMVNVEMERKFYKYIMIFKEGISYEIEKDRNGIVGCQKKPLTEPFRKVKIPENATSMGLATIGTNAVPGLGVTVAVFYGRTPAGDEYYVSVTEPKVIKDRLMCIPISEVLLSEKLGRVHTSFFDVELGVDPEEFVPPKECEYTVAAL